MNRDFSKEDMQNYHRVCKYVLNMTDHQGNNSEPQHQFAPVRVAGIRKQETADFGGDVG